MAISMLKIRRPLGRLIFNMGIAIPGKTVFLIETAPGCLFSERIVVLEWKTFRSLKDILLRNITWYGLYYYRIYGCWNKDTARRIVLQPVWLKIGYHWYISQLATATTLLLTKYIHMFYCQLQIAVCFKICRPSFSQIWNYLTKSGWRSRYGAVWEPSPLSLSWLWRSGANKPSRWMRTIYSPPLTPLGVIGASPKSNRI